MITRLYTYLPRHTLINVCKAFVTAHLDYGDIIFDNPGNESFFNKIESVQYNAGVSITREKVELRERNFTKNYVLII